MVLAGQPVKGEGFGVLVLPASEPLDGIPAGFLGGVPVVEPAQLGEAVVAEAQNSWPQSSSAIAFTRRVDTPCPSISISAATRAFSLRWWRANSSLEKRPCRSWGTRSSSLPTRVTGERADALCEGRAAW